MSAGNPSQLLSTRENLVLIVSSCVLVSDSVMDTIARPLHHMCSMNSLTR